MIALALFLWAAAPSPPPDLCHGIVDVDGSCVAPDQTPSPTPTDAVLDVDRATVVDNVVVDDGWAPGHIALALGGIGAATGIAGGVLLGLALAQPPQNVADENGVREFQAQFISGTALLSLTAALGVAGTSVLVFDPRTGSLQKDLAGFFTE
jgi:hypothetical protein